MPDPKLALVLYRQEFDPLIKNTNAHPHEARILSAATAVFLKEGFERASTAEIARVARVSKRELYLHFADKRALLAAVVVSLQSDIQHEMDSLWMSGGPMEAVLLDSATVIQKFILSERFSKLLRIVAAESFQTPEVARQFFQSGPIAGQKATARFLRQQMSAGLLRESDPLKAADDFLNLVVGAQLLTAVMLGQSSRSRPRAVDVEHAVRTFLLIYAPSRANGDAARKRPEKPRLKGRQAAR